MLEKLTFKIVVLFDNFFINTGCHKNWAVGYFEPVTVPSISQADVPVLSV